MDGTDSKHNRAKKQVIFPYAWNLQYNLHVAGPVAMGWHHFLDLQQSTRAKDDSYNKFFLLNASSAELVRIRLHTERIIKRDET